LQGGILQDYSDHKRYAAVMTSNVVTGMSASQFSIPRKADIPADGIPHKVCFLLFFIYLIFFLARSMLSINFIFVGDHSNFGSTMQHIIRSFSKVVFSCIRKSKRY
jgi:hypothetical protein